MGQVTVTNHVSLDGVMQAPAGADEDTRDGFRRGGWAVKDMDEVMGRVMAEGMAREGALLLGRRTYEHFFSFWPHQTDNPFTEVLNTTRKFVASTTLTEPLPWMCSTLLDGDAADGVARLREDPDLHLTILGSGELIRSLARRNLIDRYQLMIHPVVLGSGRRLFADDGPHAELRLLDHVTTTTGVIIATYAAAAA
jgi:dihydrofolate reductase